MAVGQPIVSGMTGTGILYVKISGPEIFFLMEFGHNDQKGIAFEGILTSMRRIYADTSAKSGKGSVSHDRDLFQDSGKNEGWVF